MTSIARIPRAHAIERINHLIGAEYAPTLKGYICEMTHIGRIVGPNEVTTREIDPDRLNVSVDEAGKITGFHLG